MDFGDLVELGLNENEAKVYLSLAQFRQAPAKRIISDLSMHKKLVYENLDELIDKGLASYVVEDNKRIYKLTNPNMLVHNVEEEQRQLQNKKDKAETVAKSIQELTPKHVHEQEAEIYRGKEGIRAFYRQLLRNEHDYCVFGAPKASLDIMGMTFWKNLDVKLQDNDIHGRLLFNQDMRSYGDSLNSENYTVRYFDKEFEPRTETNIQDNRVAIIVWTENPMLFLITDKVVSESYKQYFEHMWEEAE